MFEEFYEMYEPEEQEVVALINRCIGGGFNWKGNFWEMTVMTPVRTIRAQQAMVVTPKGTF